MTQWLTAGENDGKRKGSQDREERASRTSLPSLILSSQLGQTRGASRVSGVNTRTYASVTKEPQF